MQLYIDGVQVGSAAATGAIPTTTDPLAIANKPTSTNTADPFQGTIDEVSIHSIALSATQVQALWTSGTTGGGSTNQAPTAVAGATPTSGTAPLAVQFSSTGSADPDAGDTITYSWDLNGDGTFGDSTAASPTFTYTTAGTYTAALRVTDNHGAVSNTATVTITVSASTNTPPVPVIDAPADGTTFAVGDKIDFSGHATDAQDGALAATQLSWSLTQYHCPSSCHTHNVQNWTGVSSGTFFAPDHGYPSYLVLALTATDSLGLTATTSVRLNPKTVDLNFATSPAGFPLVVNATSMTGNPITVTVIQGSSNTVTATSPQVVSGIEYSFSSWTDGVATAGRTIVAPFSSVSPPTYTATYAVSSADVSITKSGVQSNRNIVWTIKVSDAAAGLAASGLKVTDVLPSGLNGPAASFVSGSWSCTYTSGNRTVTCTQASLAAGASSTLSFTTAVSARGKPTIVNTATVTSTTRDVTTANNSASGTVRIH
jgi:PKD repeat protein